MIYIIHLDTPIAHAKHYVGFCNDEREVQARIKEHQQGHGARLLQVALERNITFQLVATLPGNRTDERTFKNRKKTPYYCPICNPPKKQKNIKP